MYEPNLFDYSFLEISLPEGRHSAMLLRTDKKTQATQYHSVQTGWTSITDQKLNQLISLSKKHTITKVPSRGEFADLLAYVNYNEYMAHHPKEDFVEYDDLPEEEKDKWCYERFSDTDEILRMFKASDADVSQKNGKK